MSQRETQKSGSLQKWKGVDQRTQPTLIADGYFLMSDGAILGFTDDGIERLPGKTLAVKIASPIVNIVQFGSITFIQQLSSLAIIPTAELTTL